MTRWTIRTRLVVSILALTALGLALAGAVTITLLRGNLVQRLDAQFPAMEKAGPVLTRMPLPKEGLARSIAKRMAEEIYLAFYSSAGALLSSGPTSGGPVLGDPRTLPRDTPFTVPGQAGHSWRVRVSERAGLIQVTGYSLKDVEQTTRSLVAITLAGAAGVLLVLGFAAAAVVRLGLRPMTRMERTAVRIAEGDFGRRVADPDPHTEPGRLGLAMNVMLDRLQEEIAARTASEARLRRFLADASHELRTPLTSVRGFAELHRRGGEAGELDTGEMMARIEDEATRMAVLVNDLLTLAQLDEERPVESGPVDLLEIAADTIRDARARCPDRPVRLGGRPEPVTVLADGARLRQVAANLVGNALQHTPPEASITVEVTSRDGFAVLEVADTGPGLPPSTCPTCSTASTGSARAAHAPTAAPASAWPSSPRSCTRTADASRSTPRRARAPGSAYSYPPPRRLRADSQIRAAGWRT
ncbi:HAMP domain-containing histidine kinase [Nonomuraea sp. NBC_01738]|nr:HAMP domain-containing histidine kinase [Nonomuraea sp. NBC_01738]